MTIRGAPAIGVAAAMGVALGVLQGADFDTVCETLAATRPTAVNLFWAIKRMRALHESLRGQPGEVIREKFIAEAIQIRLKISRSIRLSGNTARRWFPITKQC